MKEIEKLHNFKEAMKPMINQSLEGLLYDLGLLPEQLKYEIDGKRYSAIVNLFEENKQLLETVESLKCCGNCSYWADSIHGWFCTNKDSEKPDGDFRNSKCNKWSVVVGLKR